MRYLFYEEVCIVKNIIKKAIAWRKVNAYIKMQGYTWKKESLRKTYLDYYKKGYYCSGTFHEIINKFAEEFSILFDDEPFDKISFYLKANFPEIYDHDFNGTVYLCGGAVKDIILGHEPIKDLDFVIYDPDSKHDNTDILKFAKDNNFLIINNYFGDLKLIRQDYSQKIDIWHITNFRNAMKYNMDGLFYDIQKRTFTSIEFMSGLKKGILLPVNNAFNESDERNYRRVNKFMNYLSCRKRNILLPYLKKKGCKDV